MSLRQFPYTARSITEPQPWFKDVDDHLNAENYDNGEWTPAITGLTGVPAVNATFQRWGKRCDFRILLIGTQQMTDAEISLPLPVGGSGSASSFSITDRSPVGIGVINHLAGDVVRLSNYWVTDETIVIRGNYEVEGI